jgi:hypothetical protein
MTKLVFTFLLLAGLTAPALAGPAQDAQIATYLAAAKAADPGFAGFSATRGKAFFMADHTGGKPDTPACTSCHTRDVTKAGQTRAGKAIDPMALSRAPDRYSDPAKVEKWFGRNCNSVLGRDCTPAEKGDVLTWLVSQ